MAGIGYPGDRDRPRRGVPAPVGRTGTATGTGIRRRPQILLRRHPDGSPAEAADGSVVSGWWFEAGLQRTAVPYSFMIGPAGEFGIHAQRWVPLHASIEGWVESLALT